MDSAEPVLGFCHGYLTSNYFLQLTLLLVARIAFLSFVGIWYTVFRSRLTGICLFIKYSAMTLLQVLMLLEWWLLESARN